MKVATDPYSFGEDSALLGDCIRDLGNRGTFLEIGVGNGVNIKNNVHNFKLAVGTDLKGLEALKRDGSGGEFELIVTDRALCFQSGVFDVVAFNPPYLPSESIEDIAVDGGKNGIEIPLSFLGEALRVSKQDSIILMLLSTHSDLVVLREYCSSNRLTCEVFAEKRLFFETLFVYGIRRNLVPETEFPVSSHDVAK